MREKVESLKKDNRLVELLSTTKSKYIVGTLLLSGIGIALPRIFHLLAGSSAGSVFLPMHIAVLISALVFGGISGSIVAGYIQLFVNRNASVSKIAIYVSRTCYLCFIIKCFKQKI